MSIHDPVCERARCFACLAPDGELTDLQEKFLTFHLEECSSCRAFAESVGGTTAAIRTAPPVDPPELRVTGLARRRLSARALPAAAAVAVAVTAGLAGLAGVQPQEPNGGARPEPRPGYLDSAAYELGLIDSLQRAPIRGYPGPRIAN